MSALVTQHLPLLAGAPNGIKKLRELILELAVRGRLVPQEASDGSANELLELIAGSNSKLLANERSGKRRQLANFSEDDLPFELPSSWQWVRLGEISEVIRGVTYGKSDASESSLPGYAPLLRGNNINRTLNFDRPVFVPRERISEAQYIRAGDIVIAMSSGSADLVGKAAQAEADFDGTFGAFCGVVRACHSTLFPFFKFFFQTPLYRKRAAGHGKGIGINNLQKSVLETLEVPVPPLKEQRRIFAKVDELMSLCDRLEARQADAESANAQLVEALLGSLTQARDASDFATSWQRLSQHFHTLFTTESSIDALKQTVLQLAVMGRLVPEVLDQSPANEGICALQYDEVPFGVPGHWKWVRFGDICELVTSGSRGWKEFYAAAGSVFIRSQDIKFDRLEFDNKAFVDLPPSAEGARTLVSKGDLLITITGANVGKAANVSDDIEDTYVSQHVALVRLKQPQQSPFLHRWLINSHGGRALLLTSSYGAKPGLNLQNIKDLPVPLPPIAEQPRIVAKVDQLLTLCDQLKSRLTHARQLNEQLATTLVDRAVA